LKKLFLIPFIASTTISALANAADLSSAPILPKQTDTARWTGFYLGFNRGFGGGVIDNGLILNPLNATPGVIGQSSNR
jgi:hypothetical protein